MMFAVVYVYKAVVKPPKDGTLQLYPHSEHSGVSEIPSVFITDSHSGDLAWYKEMFRDHVPELQNKYRRLQQDKQILVSANHRLKSAIQDSGLPLVEDQETGKPILQAMRRSTGKRFDMAESH